jgi:hypothetical protein
MDQPMMLLIGFVSVSVPAYPPQPCRCRVRLVAETRSPDRAAADGGTVGEGEGGPADVLAFDGCDDGLADADVLADGVLPGVAVAAAWLGDGLADDVARWVGDPIASALEFAPPDDAATVGFDNPTHACRMPVE